MTSARRIAAFAATALALGAGTAAAQDDPLSKAMRLLFPSGSAPAPQAGLTTGEIAAGLKDALRVGAARVVEMLGVRDGFNNNPEVHVPLPDSLAAVRRALARIGLSGPVDDLELRLNRAAEAAAPAAKRIFWNALSDLTFADVKAIYEGPEDAATRYFRDRTSAALTDAMRPVVARSLAEVGTVAAYDSVVGRYRPRPPVPDVEADLTGHVLARTLDGLFLYLGREEAAIRRDPARRTTETLQRVFGAAS